MRNRIIGAATALVALIGAAAVQAPAHATPTNNERSCFRSVDWRGWEPAVGGQALYLRVGLKDIYRVELTPGSPVRKMPGDYLLTETRGSGWVCSALDLDLAVADIHTGMRQPLIATAIHKLTPQEAAGLTRAETP